MTFDPHDKLSGGGLAYRAGGGLAYHAGQRSYVKILRGRREEPGNEATHYILDHFSCRSY